jgi:hypothetical protein
VPDGHPHGAIEQDRRRHSHPGLADKSFSQSQYGFRARSRRHAMIRIAIG